MLTIRRILHAMNPGSQNRQGLEKLVAYADMTWKRPSAPFEDIRSSFLVALGLHAGLRMGEIANLTCGNLISCCRSGRLAVLTGMGQKRLVNVPEVLRMRCREFLKAKRAAGEATWPDSPAFASGRGAGPMSWCALSVGFMRFSRKAGAGRYFSFYEFRRTYYLRTNGAKRSVRAALA
jgi:integrase